MKEKRLKADQLVNDFFLLEMSIISKFTQVMLSNPATFLHSIWI